MLTVNLINTHRRIPETFFAGYNRQSKRRPPQARLSLVSPQDSGREVVENYIRRQFAICYGAQVNHFLPHLFQLQCEQGPGAAVGIARAVASALFLEQYLDQPIEHELSHVLQVPVARQDVIEIGNLVATRRGTSQLLFLLLTTALHRVGFRWVVFTATREVAAIIAKSNFSPITLCCADPRRLAQGGRQWGSYFQSAPRVMVGDLALTAIQASANPAFSSHLLRHDRELRQVAEQLLMEYAA